MWVYCEQLLKWDAQSHCIASKDHKSALKMGFPDTSFSFVGVKAVPFTKSVKSVHIVSNVSVGSLVLFISRRIHQCIVGLNLAFDSKCTEKEQPWASQIRAKYLHTPQWVCCCSAAFFPLKLTAVLFLAAVMTYVGWWLRNKLYCCACCMALYMTLLLLSTLGTFHNPHFPRHASVLLSNKSHALSAVHNYNQGFPPQFCLLFGLEWQNKTSKI